MTYSYLYANLGINCSNITNVTQLSSHTCTCKNMQLEVDIEPTLRFPGMISIDKEMDQSESEVHQVQLTEPQPAAVYGI